jgi:hypothetical protein
MMGLIITLESDLVKRFLEKRNQKKHTREEPYQIMQSVSRIWAR